MVAQSLVWRVAVYPNSTIALLASPKPPSLAPSSQPANASSPGLAPVQQAVLMIAPLGGKLIDLTAGTWQVAQTFTPHADMQHENFSKIPDLPVYNICKRETNLLDGSNHRPSLDLYRYWSWELKVD
jgi:hypothetical protein